MHEVSTYEQFTLEDLSYLEPVEDMRAAGPGFFFSKSCIHSCFGEAVVGWFMFAALWPEGTLSLYLASLC